MSRMRFDGNHLSLTIAPDHPQGVSVERFVAALRAADELLTTLNPGMEPVLRGGGVDARGAVTIEAGSRSDEDADESEGTS